MTKGKAFLHLYFKILKLANENSFEYWQHSCNMYWTVFIRQSTFPLEPTMPL